MMPSRPDERTIELLKLKAQKRIEIAAKIMAGSLAKGEEPNPEVMERYCRWHLRMADTLISQNSLRFEKELEAAKVNPEGVREWDI